MATQATSHVDILRRKASRPEVVISVEDPAVEKGGDLWEGRFQPSNSEDFPLLALTSTSSWVQIRWTKPTTVVGVQFCGDSNDGWARIVVDGEVAWSGNTFGGDHKFNAYIEISDLSLATHTVRVEPTGQAGSNGGNIHVSVTAFGWGATSTKNIISNETEIFIPFIAQ